MLGASRAAGAQRAPDPPPRTAVATNPFALLLGVASVEAGHALSRRVAVQGTFSYSVGELGNWGALALPVYPLQRAFGGAYVGPTVGYQRVREADAAGAPLAALSTVPVAGFVAGYDWRIGRHVLLGLGVNMRDGLRATREDLPPTPPAHQWYGSGRLAIGFAW